ncbi:outer membrane protein [Leptolyngbya sp. Heron Island J]|uniref:TolC family protein n=1 Tax=Leptolyngbya sp. Heron Island J TaxID=1385935 RepID=UPI0003B9CC69|nr:TolC family protein [Leptolyngbya sp. Heron Island J]ESA32023.1 outer membrane protein [Leptolyngbya sp. Heron Island J]
MRLQKRLQKLLIASVLAVPFSIPITQPGLTQLPELPPAQNPEASPADDLSPSPTDNSHTPSSIPAVSGTDDSRPALALTEADVVSLLLQNNRELRNEALERIAQRQELREAESIFNPDFTPTVSVVVRDRTDDATEITREARLGGELLTPLGTTLEVTVDVIDDQDVELTVTQPLLRGAGRAVNTASVEIARLQETNNQLDLRQRLITDITVGVSTYYALIRAQASLQIQQLSFETQQQQRRSIEALVEAGRRAQFELVEIDANLAATETDVLEAENALEQAKSDLLDLLDLEDSIEITIPEEILTDLVVQEAKVLPLEELVEVAYDNRPDYRQAQLDLQIAELDEVVAVDNRRWNLDLRANASTGDFSEASTELVLTRLLEDESTETAFQRNQVTQQQLRNDLERLQSDIRLEVADQLRDVESARNRIEATRLARELAEQRLENARERARRGRTRDIFEVLELQNDVVEAQNSEVNAAIDLADAIASLNQSVGTTLTVWADQVESSQLLTMPSSPD